MQIILFLQETKCFSTELHLPDQQIFCIQHHEKENNPLKFLRFLKKKKKTILLAPLPLHQIYNKYYVLIKKSKNTGIVSNENRSKSVAVTVKIKKSVNKRT